MESKTEDRLDLQFVEKGDLIGVIVQDSRTGEILMKAYSNPQAFEETLRTRNATFWSRSRNELWIKGDTSGNYLRVDEAYVDCDQDCLLYKVTPQGSGACHTKDEQGQFRKSCFYRKINLNNRTLETR